MKKFYIAKRFGQTDQIECEEFSFKGMPLLLHKCLNNGVLWVVSDKITGTKIAEDCSKVVARYIAKEKIKEAGIERYMRCIIKQCGCITIEELK